MIIEYIKGNILDAPQTRILHGVNCQNAMGSGVAKVLFEKYPKIKTSYHNHCNNVFIHGGTSKDLLGTYKPVICDDKVIFNAFTQEYYGYDGQKYVSYDAIYEVFNKLSYKLKTDLAIPKIGCGLAGGNWDIVSKIIDDATGDRLNIYVYHLD